MRARQLHVVLLHLPVSDWYAQVYSGALRQRYRRLLHRIAEESDCPLFLFKKQTIGLKDSDYFRRDGRFDGHHIISQAARDRLGDTIGAQIARPLLLRLKRGEAVGFAQSHLEEVLP